MDVERLLLSFNSKSYVWFRFAYLQLTLALSKGHGRGHADFDRECVANSDRSDKTYYCHRIIVSTICSSHVDCKYLVNEDEETSRKNGKRESEKRDIEMKR